MLLLFSIAIHTSLSKYVHRQQYRLSGLTQAYGNAVLMLDCGWYYLTNPQLRWSNWQINIELLDGL